MVKRVRWMVGRDFVDLFARYIIAIAEYKKVTGGSA